MSRWDARAPGEDEARERTWRVVRAAFESRERLPRRRSRTPRRALALAAAAPTLPTARSTAASTTALHRRRRGSGS